MFKRMTNVGFGMVGVTVLIKMVFDNRVSLIAVEELKQSDIFGLPFTVLLTAWRFVIRAITLNV